MPKVTVLELDVEVFKTEITTYLSMQTIPALDDLDEQIDVTNVITEDVDSSLIPLFLPITTIAQVQPLITSDVGTRTVVLQPVT